MTTGQLAEAQEADRVSGQNLSANALYQIIAGERRWRASLEAGLAQIPILLDENVSDDTAAEIALVENLQREGLPPLDTADALAQLQHQGYSLRKLAVRLGKQKGWVEQYLALAFLPGDVRSMVSGRPDSLTHAREVGKVTNLELRAELIASVLDAQHPLPLAELRCRIRQASAAQTPENAPPLEAEALEAEALEAADNADTVLEAEGLETEGLETEGLETEGLETEGLETEGLRTSPETSEGPETLGGLRTSPDTNGALAEAVLRRETLKAQLRTLPHDVNNLDRPADPAILAEMTQLLQKAQAALTAALERWAL